MVLGLDFKELTFKELGVLGYLMGVPIYWAFPIAYWAFSAMDWAFPRRLFEESIRRRLFEETIRGDYSKETIRRSGAHDIFWSGT